MLEKIKNNLTNIIFGIIFIYIFVLNIVKIGENNSNIIILYVSAIVLFVFILKKIILIKDTKIINKISKIILFINFGILIYLGCKLRVGFTWDYGNIQTMAIEYANFGSIQTRYYFTYITRCPNNRLITILLSIIYKAFHIIFGIKERASYCILSIIINSSIIAVSYFFTYKLAQKVKGDKFAFIILIFIELMLPMSSYSAIFYSDTIGLFFIPVIILLYLKFKESNKIKYLILSTIISLIGFEIKATIIFSLIAILIDIICNNKFKLILKNSFIIILVFIISYLFMDISMDYFFNIKSEDKELYMFPHTHHIMMALNKTGGYVYDDVLYTLSFNTYDKKIDANIEKIKERIEKRGISGTLHHMFYTKMVRTWTDSNFASSNYLNRQPIYNNFFNSFINKGGENYKYYKMYTDIYWLFILSGMILASVIYKEKNEIITMCKIIITFLTLFLIIWECNSRYVIHMMPLIILISGYGWYNLINKIPPKLLISSKK